MADELPSESKTARFWLDVLSQTISGVLVVVIVYWGAILLGYLAAPEVQGVLRLVLYGSGLLVPGVIANVLISRRVRRKRTHPLVVVLLVLVAVAAFVYCVSVMVQNPPEQDFLNPFPSF